MQDFTYQQAVNLPLLMEQLVALPALAPKDGEARFFLLQRDDGTVVVRVPDGVAKPTVDRVLAAHDHTAPSVNDAARDNAAALYDALVSASTNWGELDAAAKDAAIGQAIGLAAQFLGQTWQLGPHAPPPALVAHRARNAARQREQAPRRRAGKRKG